MDSYMQEPGRRVSKATELVNVVATLPGKSPASAARTIVIGGHYDSIPTIRGDVDRCQLGRTGRQRRRERDGRRARVGRGARIQKF